MNWINVGVLLLKLCTSFVYSKAEETTTLGAATTSKDDETATTIEETTTPVAATTSKDDETATRIEEKYWLGPTRCIWTRQCNSSDTGNKKNLDDCKLACENSESCNAITFKEDSVASQCNLTACDSPVPPPIDPGNGEQGYYQGAADENVKCPDMNVEELGSTQCNIADDSNGFTWIESSRDEGQDCLCTCIAHMKWKKWEDACCAAEKLQGSNNGKTFCWLYNLVDVIEGDENSTDRRAVNCKVEPLTDTQASSDTSKTLATTKLDSITTSTTDMSATKNQINPEDPDDGADSGSSTCKLNGKKKTFLMIHVTITQILLMLLVIKHKNV